MQIHPWDKNFALGMYYIGVYGSKGSINSFTVKFLLCIDRTVSELRAQSRVGGEETDAQER